MKSPHARPCAALAALLVVLALAGCGQPPARTVRRARPAPSPSAMVASIRAAGTQDQSAVEVAPLRDPAVQHLVDAAHADESAGRYQQAADAIDQALKLSPKSPDLLQYRAELAVWLHRYDDAVRLSQQSFLMGPREGSLCARNWQTVVEMHQRVGDGAGAQSAARQRDRCHVKGVVRM